MSTKFSVRSPFSRHRSAPYSVHTPAPARNWYVASKRTRLPAWNRFVPLAWSEVYVMNVAPAVKVLVPMLRSMPMRMRVSLPGWYRSVCSVLGSNLPLTE